MHSPGRQIFDLVFDMALGVTLLGGASWEVGCFATGVGGVDWSESAQGHQGAIQPAPGAFAILFVKNQGDVLPARHERHPSGQARSHLHQPRLVVGESVLGEVYNGGIRPVVVGGIAAFGWRLGNGWLPVGHGGAFGERVRHLVVSCFGLFCLV